MPLERKTPFPSTNPVVSRTLSAFELLFGAFIVIGHNVFHIVPNEVIILSISGLGVDPGSGMADCRRWDSSGLYRGGGSS